MTDSIQSEELLIGHIIGEFRNAWDAQQFRMIHGPQRCVVTAGINFPFAVRELRRVIEEKRDETH